MPSSALSEARRSSPGRVHWPPPPLSARRCSPRPLRRQLRRVRTARSPPAAGLIERQYPSTDSSAKGSLRYREQVGLRCKVRAQNIEGNDIWYLLRDRSTWVSAKYMDNTGYVQYCKDVMRDGSQTFVAPRGAKG